MPGIYKRPQQLVEYCWNVLGGEDQPCMLCSLFFFFLIYLFIIYFWLCWVFVAARGLFSSCGDRGLLFVAVRGLLTAVASPVAEHGL